MENRSSHLVVVPAYNEAATVGRRGRLDARAHARLRRPRRRRRLDRRAPAQIARARRRDRCCGTRSTSVSAAPCSPASCTRSSTATTTWSRSTATASTAPRRSASCSSSDAREPDARHGLRLALPERGHGYPAPISRRTGIHIFAFLLSRLVRPAGERPDVGLPALQPPRRSRCSRATTRTTTRRSRRC